MRQRIDSAQNDRNAEKERKKKAQSDYKESILQQMAEQVSSILTFIIDPFCFFCSLYKNRDTRTNTRKSSQLASLPRRRKENETPWNRRSSATRKSSRRCWTPKSQRGSNTWKPNERIRWTPKCKWSKRIRDTKRRADRNSKSGKRKPSRHLTRILRDKGSSARWRCRFEPALPQIRRRRPNL